MSELPIRRALLSVSDKTGLIEFSTGLLEFGVEIISTGGTAKALREADLPIIEIDDFTGFPEMLDGRVKTLHPKVHAGILYRRDLPTHVETIEEHNLRPIDLVVVNLYPFESTVAKSDVSYAEAVEQVDIGGPSMVRSAAKNHAHVTVVVAPEFYSEVLQEMRATGGATTFAFRQRLATRAFERTAAYDSAISSYFGVQLRNDGIDTSVKGARSEEAAPEAEGAALPPDLSLTYPKARELRYGENPHQKAALYGTFLERFEQLHGKELSYNNILDLTAAREMAEDLGSIGPAVAIIKHSNPCGVAIGADLSDAWRKALSTDAASASGGIIACSEPVDEAAADAMRDHFIEVLIAPSYLPGALEKLSNKKNRILLQCPDPLFSQASIQWRSVPGGLLAQTEDRPQVDDSACRVVTQRQPTDQEWASLRFAWRVVRFVKSNAIVFTNVHQTLGVGAGQMSRVDSARLASMKASQAGLDLNGSAVASDAFFPFADGLVTVADSGARSVIQPGGSVRDEEVIRAADERGIAMVFTGARHFRH